MKYHKLTFIEEAGTNKHQKRLWRCKCDCGNETVAVATQIRTGKTKSCGCMKSAGNRRTHGLRQTNHGKQSKTYTAWVNMKRRCNGKNVPGYHNYGGRGITYSPEWETFEGFYADMGESPEGLSLEREDNEKGYSKENCLWATRSVQSLNTRQNHYVTYNGKTQTIKEWADELGLKYQTLFCRINRGMSPEEALTTKLYRINK